MVRDWKRIVAIVMTALLLFESTPAAAFASVIDNAPQENQEILSELESLVGSEEEARQYYSLLEQYDLLDEDGRAVESWTIERDGKEVTLEDIRKELEGDFKEDDTVTVDGATVTLADLKTMLEIEDYIAYLRETYFTDGEWTQEQIDALDSLKKQIDEEGIQVIAADPDLNYPSGINHAARVSVNEPAIEGSTATFTVTLTNAKQNQTASFDYHALPGSQTLAAESKGSMSLSGENPTGTIAVQLNELSEMNADETAIGTVSIAPSFYLNLSNLKGALFANGRIATSLAFEAEGTVTTDIMPESGAFTHVLGPDSGKKGVIELSDGQRRAIRWGMTNEIYPLPDPLPTVESMIEYWVNPEQGGNPEQEDFAPATKELREKYTPTRDFEFGVFKEKQIDLIVQKNGEPLINVGICGWARKVLKEPNGLSTPDGLIGYLDYAGRNDRPGSGTEIRDTFRADMKPKMWDDAFSYKGKEFYYKILGTFAYRDGDECNETAIYYPSDSDQYDPDNQCTWNVNFLDNTAPKVESITAPAGTYYPGQVVPVTVRVSEPVKPSDIKLKFNGADKEYAGTGKDDALTNVVVVEYPVAELDGTTLSVSAVSGQDASGNKLEEYVLGDPEAGVMTQLLEGVAIVTPDKLSAIQAMTATLGGTAAKPELKVDVELSDNEKLTTWIKTVTAEAGAPGTAYARDLSVSFDGGKTSHKLYTKGDGLADGLTTGPIDCGPNAGPETLTHIAELYIAPEEGAAPELAVGRYAKVDQAPVKFITKDDFTLDVSVLDSKGEDYKYADDTKTIYAQDEPQITGKATVEGDANDFAFGNVNNATVWLESDDPENRVPEDSGADFVWGTTDPTVLKIDKTGKATPTGKAGKAQITLTAWNGGVEGKSVTLEGPELNFGAGLTPFLIIPNKEITAEADKDLTIFWSSNLCDKNGKTETVFDVIVQREGPKEQPYTVQVKGTAEAPAASVDIPAKLLTYDYKSGKNTFTVTVSSTYKDKKQEDTATITLDSKPASVKLAGLGSYYVTDAHGPLDIGWTIKNFVKGKADTSELFEFKVTNDRSTYSETVTIPGTDKGDGNYEGSFPLTPADVIADKTNPASYRDVYTVTVKAKNSTDSTWSYDSFVLYVYDAAALQIVVDGAEPGDKLTMSNNEEFGAKGEHGDVNSGTWRDWVLGLDREINLRDVISANYGEYAWTEIADQISWASSDSSVASVNYQQGTLYENIENFDYTSYRPTTDFVLSGLKDGSTTVTATHKLTQMADTVDVTVDTMKDKLYLFQCYPQTKTKLTFDVWTNAERTEKKRVEAMSDEHGAAAYYADYGIASDVWCESTVGEGDNAITYLGTFYLSDLQTGERDSTKLELYPCNNLQLRRAAYAYLYLKNPDGTPYSGDITFRGGVYVDGEYKEKGLFQLNGSEKDLSGDKDQVIKLDSTGRLEVVMDQTQWGLEGNQISAGDDIQYVFQIEQGDQTKDNAPIDYYPLLVTINAKANEDAFVGAGEAAVNFRKNKQDKAQPFIAGQVASYTGTGGPTNLLNHTDAVGPSDSCPEAVVTTAVMWWGKDATKDEVSEMDARVELVTSDNRVVADKEGTYEVANTAYPFTDILITQHTAKLNKTSMDGLLDAGKEIGLKLNYYADGETLTRSEALPFDLCNMLGLGRIEEKDELKTQLQAMGGYVGTDSDAATQFDSKGDSFVKTLLELVADDDYSADKDSAFTIKIAPTADPTKFLGFISVGVGGMDGNDQVSGVYAQEGQTTSTEYTPGFAEAMMLVGAKSPFQYAYDQMDDFFKATKNKAVRSTEFGLGGYAESMIYYDRDTGKWEIQILEGGFNAGGGASYSWNFNTWCGPIPFTATLTAGATAEISMDALTVAYANKVTGKSGLDNDFLTQLRLYLYLRFFAGVGFDYAIVAFKLGVFGQVNADMRFQWLNRPYLADNDDNYNVADGGTNEGFGNDNALDGQRYKIDGQVGLEFLMKLLFLKYEKILYSYSFDLLDKTHSDWDEIQTDWTKNSAAKQEAIGELVKNGSASIMDVGGQQMVALNMAPTVESRDYLDEGGRSWGPGFQLFGLDLSGDETIKSLESNTYPYANPVVSDDGSLVAYLSDMDDKDAEKTRAKVGARTENGGYAEGELLPTPTEGETGDGYGDSQVTLAGTSDFAVAAWTRQTKSIEKDAGATVTAADQLMMLESTDVYASVKTGEGWTSTRLSTSDGADLAPVVATNGKTGNDARAIVTWRSVASSGKAAKTDAGAQVNPTDFDQKDTIVYKVYSNGEWGEEQTLYNGTSGAVKALVANMMSDGTAAVAYTLDTDSEDGTLTDREIAYVVVDNEEGEVARTVQATTDSYLDENPQLASVTFGDNKEHFVLGWYSEEAASSDGAQALSDGEGGATEGTTTKKATETTSDIRLIDFDNTGTAGQKLPDSLSKAADSYGVNITSNFRFAKNAESIDDLSILWVERAEAELEEMEEDTAEGSVTENLDTSKLTAERDMLKAVKFYTTGLNKEIVRYTSAIDVADMEEADAGTLIDHFDAYVNNTETNQVKAVILGTTYGKDGKTVTKTGETVGGDKVQYTVPASETAMYTATGNYADVLEVPNFIVDWETVKLGANAQFQFSVENSGIHAINKVDIQIGEGENNKTSYDNLNLMPGETIQLQADYTVPDDKVEDPEWKVTAEFDEDKGASGSAETGGSAGFFGLFAEDGTNVVKGTAYLDLPDTEITDAQIVEEQGGKRTIQVKLNNHAASKLKGSGREVRLGFYSDATCETPIATFAEGSKVKDGVVTISDDDDLAMIDEGGYALQETFDVEKFVQEASKKDDESADGKAGEEAGGDAAATAVEIPETGVAVYMKVEVYERAKQEGEAANAEGDDWTLLGEPISSDNYAQVRADNLAVRTGEEVSIVSELVADADKKTATVTVDLQNNRLAKKTTGNLIVALLDKDGKVIAQKQSYKKGEGDNNGLVMLNGEDSHTQEFNFEGVTGVADVRVTYSDAKLGEDQKANARLDQVKVDGVTLTYDEATKTYAGAADAAAQRLLTIAAENLDATITVNGQKFEGPSKLMNFPGGTTTYKITVAPPVGEPVDYTLVVTAPSSGVTGGGSVTYPVETPDKPAHGSVSVSPDRARPGQTVTVTPKPDDGYTVGSVEVTDSAGNSIEVTNKGDGTWTFTMPSGKVDISVWFKCTGGDKCPSRKYKDVAVGTWYHEAIDWAVENGVLHGYNPTTMGPEDKVTRAQMAAVLYNSAGSPDASGVMGKLDRFADLADGAWYEQAVAWAVSEGLFSGYDSTGRFGPDDPLTREQAAAVLRRWEKRLGGEVSQTADLSQYPDAGKVSDWATEAVSWAVAAGVINGTVQPDGTRLLDPQGTCTRAMVAALLMNREKAEE